MAAVNVLAVSGFVYRCAWLLARPLASLLAVGGGKTARTLRGRIGAVPALRAWASHARDTSRPLVWFHAASVGEGRQAEVVLARLRALRPEWQLAYTYSSSSAERFAATLPADVAGYLPLDTAGACGAALDALAPGVLVFSATDIWPELVRQAARRGVRIAVISATLAPTSSRRRWPARALLRSTYAALDAAGAIDPRDAEALRDIGVPGAHISVTGDTRHDAVAARAAQPAPARAHLLAALGTGAPIVVAGSTWPADDAALLPAIAWLRERQPVRLVVAPHEPSVGAVARLLEQAKGALGAGVVVRTLGNVERDGGAFDVCIVDRVGVLFDLYAGARMAFVGGGFHDKGLHSVIEPAALGVPVVFGPRWRSSRDARLLQGTGGGREAPGAPALGDILLEWARNDAARDTAGAAARAVVDAGTGAADRSAQLVIELAERRGD